MLSENTMFFVLKNKKQKNSYQIGLYHPLVNLLGIFSENFIYYINIDIHEE